MAKTWRRLPAKTHLRRVDEQANCQLHLKTRFQCHSRIGFIFYLACPNTLLSKFTASPVATLRHRNILD
jgi:hypothetical protein